jgi:hypothetical protein
MSAFGGKADILFEKTDRFWLLGNEAIDAVLSADPLRVLS